MNSIVRVGDGDGLYGEQWNFGPAHRKSYFKGIFGCIFRQSVMKYRGNKSIKENSLYIFSEKIKITKNVPVQVIFTGKIFYK
jgi:hypothetical protein